jgi:hypothetical protein
MKRINKRILGVCLLFSVQEAHHAVAGSEEAGGAKVQLNLSFNKDGSLNFSPTD